MASKKKATAKAKPKGPPASAPAPTPPAAPKTPKGPPKAQARTGTQMTASAPPASTAAAAQTSTPAPKKPRTRRAPVLSEGLDRPDPDQPPVEVVAERPSVYSEWLNQSPQAPNWLNSPPPRKPSPTAKRRAAAKSAQPEDPMQQVLNDQPAPPPPREVVAASASRPAPRRRTTARRITQAERLSVTSAELEAVVIATAPQPVAAGAARAITNHPTAAGLRPGASRTATHIPAHPSMHSTPPARRHATSYPVASSPRAPHDGWNALPVAEQRNMGERSTGAQARPTRPPLNGNGSGGMGLEPRETTARIAAADGGSLPRAGERPTSELAVGSVAGGGLSAAPAERAPVDSESILIRGARRPPVSTTGPVAPRRKGPHPVLAQALVAVFTIAALLAAVTITSPLGYGAALSGTFQAYANAVPWVPTPTPTPKPPPITQNTGGHAVSPGTQVVIDDIKAVFGQYATGALNIARCESGYDPNARNPYAVGDSHAEGVFQILYPSTWNGTSYHAQSPYDYDANIHAAYEIFSRDGNSWREWECKPY